MPPHFYCSKIPIIMTFSERPSGPNLFVFSRFFCVCHRLHTSQCKISEPSGRLQFKAPSPVFAISTSPLPSVEAHKTTTRSPVVTTGTDPDKSGTNLYRLSDLQKLTGRIFKYFSRLLLQVAADNKGSDVYGVNEKKENQEDYFSGEKKCYFASGAFGIIGLAPNIPILPIIYAPLALTTQIFVFPPIIHFICLNQYELRNVSVENICIHSLEVIMVILAGCDVKS